MAKNHSAAIARFVESFGDTRTLTREEEIAAVTSGDTDALVRSQIRFVASIANRLANKHSFGDIDALLSAGACSLIGTIERFDLSKNCRLTTFAYRPIRWAMLDEINERGLGPTVHLKSRGAPTVKLDDTLCMVAYSPDIGSRFDAKQDVSVVLQCLAEDRREMLLDRFHGATLAELAEKHNTCRSQIAIVLEQSISKIRQSYPHLQAS